MDTEGTLSPATPAEARTEYESLIPTAKVVTREAAKAMSFDSSEYADRVTADVIASVRDALFASLLEVHVGDRQAFDSWCEDHPEYEPVVTGSENAGRIVWHAPAFADRVVAATFNDEREAAVGTLRRQAFGQLYREHLETDEDARDGDGDGDSDGDSNANGDGDSDGDNNANGDGDSDDGTATR
jgi:hypothetical protein